MNREFIEAIDELEKEKHISKDILSQLWCQRTRKTTARRRT